MSVRITPYLLRSPHTQRKFNDLVEELSADVAGAHYDDPRKDDFKQLDEAIADGLTEFLLGLDLPDQITREEAAMHDRADRDAEAA